MFKEIIKGARETESIRNLKHDIDVLALRAKCLLGRNKADLRTESAKIRQNYYLAYFMEALCNFRCSYCIQTSMDGMVRKDYEKIQVDRVIDYLKTECLPREKTLAVVGGEVTLNPHFAHVIESLHEDFYITVTTNMATRMFKDFDSFLAWAVDLRVRWHTSYHPEFMKLDLYIERIRRMIDAGLEVGQIAAVDLDLLPEESRRQLLEADIGFEFQEFHGLHPETGKMEPRHMDHWNWDYQQYVERCDRTSKTTCRCKTTMGSGHARHLISSDGKIYNCHHLLYNQKNPIGHVDDGWPENLLEPISCSEYGFCNPVDFLHNQVVSIDPDSRVPAEPEESPCSKSNKPSRVGSAVPIQTLA